ncbi:MAG: hypothetical protein M1819_003031 [Sarea resinae]|nr:MAG: hypothetical protein M1819_003031 [Sarea resinae]
MRIAEYTFTGFPKHKLGNDASPNPKSAVPQRPPSVRIVRHPFGKAASAGSSEKVCSAKACPPNNSDPFPG